MSDGIGLAEALLGLEGFRVLELSEGDDEVVVTIETTLELVGCGGCGTRAEAQGRMAIDIRDLACFGRPARLRWIKRRWRCVDADCDTRTWTERSTHVDAQAVLTRRPGPRRPARLARRPERSPGWRPSWGCAGGRS
jgi:transposase